MRRGLLPAKPAHLFFESIAEAAFGGTLTLSDGDIFGETSLCRRLGSHKLAYSEKCTQVDTGAT